MRYAGDQEQVRFCVRDGQGLVWLRRELGLEVAWITGRGCPAVERRAAELGVQHLVMRPASKREALRAIQEQLGVGPDATLAMGDDLPDLGSRPVRRSSARRPMRVPRCATARTSSRLRGAATVRSVRWRRPCSAPRGPGSDCSGSVRMKRVAAFLLLFTGGIALLVLFDETGAGRADRGGASSPAGPGAEPGRARRGRSQRPRSCANHPGPRSPARSLPPSAVGPGPGVARCSSSSTSRRDTSRGRLRAEDLQPLGDAARTPYAARGVVLEEFEPEPEQALRTVRAEAADLVLDLTSGLAAPEIADRGEVTFTGVELVQERDLPQAPVTIRATEVRAELERGVYSRPRSRSRSWGLAFAPRGAASSSRPRGP